MRGRAAVPAIAALIGAPPAQPTNPQSRCSGIPLDARVCMDERTEGKIEPGRGELKSLSAGTGLEVPGQQRLSSRVIQRTTVDDCLLVDGSSDLEETTFSPEDFVIRVKPASQTSPFDSS
ncbi:unnamed protein product [Ascophyllum nodosum]